MSTMERRPVIGVARLVDLGKPIYQNYLNAVEAGGGTPLVLEPIIDDIDGQIASCDGFIFMGGPDFSQSISRSKVVLQDAPQLGAELERYYLEFGRRVLLGTQKPALGICLGCQLINIVYGGTLIGDIGEQVSGSFWHKRPKENNKLETMHEVLFPEDSPLRGLFGCDWMCANSSHHQAVETLGDGLRVAAVARDGVIEAIAHDDFPMRFVLGLQWHPERIYNIVYGHLAVFNALCDAAGRNG